MPTLLGTYRSRASRNVWLAEEAGIDLPLKVVWQANRLDAPDAPGAPLNTRSPAFLELSPMGAVPVLKDGDLVLTESLAINLYLAKRYGGDLGPRDDAEAALMTQWALFAATSIENAALSIQHAYQQERAESDGGRAEIERAQRWLARPLGALEEHFAQDWHLVGGRFTVADINLAEVLRYAQAHPGFLNPYPATEAWLMACQARPAFKRMWEKRESEPLRP